MISTLLRMVYDTMPTMSWLELISILIWAIPPFRTTFGAVWHYTNANAPRWFKPVLVVCAFIPGPLDEGLAVIVVLVWLMASPQRRKEMAALTLSAWHAGMATMVVSLYYSQKAITSWA